MRRLRALIRKEFTHMRRDPRTLVMILIMPILQLFLLGYISNDVRNISAVVFDQDNSRASRALLDAYRAADYFSLDYVAYSEADVTQLIDSGQARAGIIIPPSYGGDLAAGRSAEVAVLIDGSDPTIANAALSAATFVGQAHATNIRFQQLAARGPAAVTAGLPFEVRTRVLYNPDLLSSYNIVPGLIGTILLFTTMGLTANAIVRERERGTIEQLIVTPIRNWELILAKITPFILVSMVDVVLILLVGTLWFGVPIRGSVLLLLALSGLYLLPNLGLGLLISTFARTQQEAQIVILPLMLPFWMLSGFIFPIAAMPAALQVISRFIPLTYFLVIVRSIVIKGVGTEILIPQIAALSIFAVLLLGIAALRFRKTLD
ncbi:MAG: ABC transporter permease [Chloroflexi bacterium]|nr:ABC transporter permease [Chloroflexota bacterium]